MLVDRSHFTADLLPNAAHVFEDLDFAVRLVGDDDALAPGQPFVVDGVWADGAVAVRHATPAPPGDQPWQAHSAAPPARPADVPGPPGELERQLLHDGTITARLPYPDGTLHVVADDVARARSLLEPLYGPALRVERAAYSEHQRQVARAALHTIHSMDLTCATGEEVHDLAHPVEMVHSIEVVWVRPEVAAALSPVAEGLVRVTSHVAVLTD